MDVIEAGWLPLSDACRQIGMSPRTMETWVRNKKIKSKLVQREGRSPERIFEAHDVGRLAKEKEQRRLAIKPKQPVALARTEKPIAANDKLAEVDRRYQERIAEIDRKYEEQMKRHDEQVNRLLGLVVRKPWLTLDEAAECSGLPRSLVSRLAADGKITAIKCGAWRIQRASLEAFAG